MAHRLNINIRETVRDSGEYEFRIRNNGEHRLENIRFYYGYVLGPSCWYDDTHLGYSDRDIPPMVIESLDPQEERSVITRLWGTLRDYEKKNSRPIWNTTKFVKVDNFADFSKQSYPDGVNVLADVVIEKPTYVTFTYGDGTGDKKGQSWSY